MKDERFVHRAWPDPTNQIVQMKEKPLTPAPPRWLLGNRLTASRIARSVADPLPWGEGVRDAAGVRTSTVSSFDVRVPPRIKARSGTPSPGGRGSPRRGHRRDRVFDK